MAAALRITHNETEYLIPLGSLSAIDSKDFRKATGVSLAQVIAEGSGDIDTMAALVWLHRRKRDRSLTFAQVAQEFKYDSDLDIDLENLEGEAAAEQFPEA